ncbi:MAG: hypothetical protein HY742_10405 [Deltaproteobacteria bacterium]|nr:hypothetical protein [Deltaproteobacteria bacterium]
MKTFRLLAFGVLAFTLFYGTAWATPSTQIWIPSTDIVPFKTVHFGFDTYIKTESRDDGTTESTVTNLGLTAGALPFKTVQMEVGIDYRDTGGNHVYPLLFNAKVGIPEEGALFKYSPAIAVGGYDFGTEKDVTDYNIYYLIAAKTLGALGRFSAGYYTGNDRLLTKTDGTKDNKGILLSWDRTISEISDKLWLAVDYMGGKNSYGALSAAFAWKFAPNVGVLFGYDVYNESAYKPTATIQVDIDF